MFGSKRREKKLEEKVGQFNCGQEDLHVSTSLSENAATMRKLFENVDIMRYKTVAKEGEETYLLVFSDGMVDSSIINEGILRPLMRLPKPEARGDLMQKLALEIVEINESELVTEFSKIVSSVCYGDTVLFAEGAKEAAILNTKSFPLRAIDEPDSEKNLVGPREGFNESLMQNLSLLRRRARTNDLKIRQMTFGRRTQTAAAICYFDGVVHRAALEELMRRLATIDIDGVLDTNYLVELVRERRHSLFRTIGYTERPDVAIGKMLEGRVTVILDGTPIALTLPYLFMEHFQSSEDYYLSFYYTSFARLLRILGFFMTICVPGLYIAIVAFQHEMLPSPLLINITSERMSVPLPAAVEAFVMLIVFDILRETGVRMPSNVGQALSIVGALVIGQAAVEAKLVASPMIIIVAITGITNLLVPRLNAPVIYLRLMVLLLSSMFGFFGLAMGLSLILMHLISLNSFGMSMLPLEGGTRIQQWKDIAVRAPWWDMITRPRYMSKDRRRQNPPGEPDA